MRSALQIGRREHREMLLSQFGEYQIQSDPSVCSVAHAVTRYPFLVRLVAGLKWRSHVCEIGHRRISPALGESVTGRVDPIPEEYLIAR